MPRSAAKLNIHLDCLVLDGVCRRSTEGAPGFVDFPAPTDEVLQAVLQKLITLKMKMRTRRAVLAWSSCQLTLARQMGTRWMPSHAVDIEVTTDRATTPGFERVGGTSENLHDHVGSQK